MFGLGSTELIILLSILLLLFGSAKLPQLGSGLGQGIRNFKKAISSGKDKEKSSSNNDEEEDDTSKPQKNA